MGELIYFPSNNSNHDTSDSHFQSRGTDRQAYTKKIEGIFTAYLEKNGLRLTNPRRRILDYLLKADRHLNQEDIYTSLRQYGVGRATVFRTIKMLEESHLLSRVTGHSGPPRFEIHFERPHHDHLVCISCGKIQEIQWPALEKIQERGCEKIGFEIKWHRHEIFGLCKDCRRKALQNKNLK